MQSQAGQTPGLAEGYQRTHLILVFFVDFMIQESQLSFRSNWVPLAYDLKELAGYEKFFDLLEQDLADPTDGATERLLVYYTCLGLGFTGVYFDQKDRIQQFMARMAARLSRFMDADESSRLCPQAYDYTDTRDLTEPPGTKLLGIGIALAGLTVVLVITYFLARHWASGEIRKTIETINSPITRQIGVNGYVS
jgi:type VI protein secretion system component VasF